VVERHGLDSPAAAAARELGYVEFLQARYERAEAWLARALRLAVADPAERGRIGSVLGAVRSDTAHYARAAATLGEACEMSERAGDGRRVAYTLSMLGRVQLLTGELDAAATTLDASLARMRRESWAAFAPWPEALAASGCPTPTCGSRATRATRCARSVWNTSCRRRRRGSTISKRSRDGPACVSSPRGRTPTAAASATRPR
jgi:tetratricopeptide (TPR) repeat protein